ncbi:zinc-dependent alcohol dehydrogenase family protein [Kallotenue papyrolyticum]|uniref:zinc-dependent alcohol dehydrogenase family protein n=1 Tax=Kallotenue papyrolyticum TaxID=1325125 RepID=UPI0004786166|nr:zinc-dependent alcohol dehydrogenase family protein [Kallotenue papyrolyticum]
MRAMVMTAFGGPDVFEAREVERPTPGPGQLLVRVIASGTNPVDAKIRQNGTWAGIQPPAILGYDVSGVVEAVGPGVEEFKPGDEVYYTPEIFNNPAGSYAEYNLVAARIVAHKPRTLSHVEAAVPLAGGTAWEAIVRRLQVRPGETILIHGGAGGVGSFAVQFAKAAGARVLATAGTDNQATLRELGVDVPIDYRTQDPYAIALSETDGRGVDAVFDTVGGDLIVRSLTATRPFGRLASILGVQGDLTPAYLRNQTLYGVFLTRERARLEEMRPLLERGQVRPLIDAVLPLAQVAQAHARLDSGHGRGKIVLRVAEE